MHIHFLLAAALFAAAPVWAVHKCTGPDGKVAYQATACPNSGELVGEEIARREAEARRHKAAEEKRAAAQENTARIRAQMEANKLLERQKVCQGQVYDEPFVGMTEHALKSCTHFWERHGPGAGVNETETARSIGRQYVFRGGGIKYLYTSNGVVTAIQR